MIYQEVEYFEVEQLKKLQLMGSDGNSRTWDKQTQKGKWQILPRAWLILTSKTEGRKQLEQARQALALLLGAEYIPALKML